MAGQALSLLCFACLGLGLGILYDLLRPFRYYCQAGIFWDALFCAAGAGGFFALSMRSGRLELWTMAAALLLFCLYINLLSPLLLPLFLGIFNSMHDLCVFILQGSKKLQISVKKFFTNVPD